MADQSNNTIQAGDTVMLKSEGPIMTVEEVDGIFALCKWFEKGQLSESKFYKTSLKKVNPDDYK